MKGGAPVLLQLPNESAEYLGSRGVTERQRSHQRLRAERPALSLAPPDRHEALEGHPAREILEGDKCGCEPAQLVTAGWRRPPTTGERRAPASRCSRGRSLLRAMAATVTS